MSNSASVQNISTRNTEKTELRFTSLNSSAGKANISFQHSTNESERIMSLGIDSGNLLHLKNSNVDVNGTLGLREFASPATPSANNGGVIWTSTDGKLYFKSNEISTGRELSDYVIGSNIGSGVGIYKQRTNDNLEFKKITSGNAQITVTDDTSNDSIKLTNNITLNNATGSIGSSLMKNTGLQTDYQLKTITGGVGVSIGTQGDHTLIINSTGGGGSGGSVAYSGAGGSGAEYMSKKAYFSNNADISISSIARSSNNRTIINTSTDHKINYFGTSPNEPSVIKITGALGGDASILNGKFHNVIEITDDDTFIIDTNIVNNPTSGGTSSFNYDNYSSSGNPINLHTLDHSLSAGKHYIFVNWNSNFNENPLDDQELELYYLTGSSFTESIDVAVTGTKLESLYRSNSSSNRDTISKTIYVEVPNGETYNLRWIRKSNDNFGWSAGISNLIDEKITVDYITPSLSYWTLGQHNISGTNFPTVYFGESSTNTNLGRVGIGISTPLQPLHVKGNSFYDGNVGIGHNNPAYKLQFEMVNESKIALFTDSPSRMYGFGISAGQLNYHVQTSGDKHIFYAGGNNGDGTELMRIQGDGNVGIGTTNPESTMTIKGNINNYKESNYPYRLTSFALNINGETDQYAYSNDATAVTATNTNSDNLTIEIWFKTTKSTAGAQFIFMKGNFGYGIHINSETRKIGYINITSTFSSTGYHFTPDNVYEVNKWQHLAVTVNMTNYKLNFYINGTNVHTFTGTSSSISTRDYWPGTALNRDLWLGREGATSTNNFQGYLSDLRIWKAELSQSTIQAWYNKDLDSTHPNSGDLGNRNWNFDSRLTTINNSMSWILASGAYLVENETWTDKIKSGKNQIGGFIAENNSKIKGDLIVDGKLAIVANNSSSTDLEFMTDDSTLNSKQYPTAKIEAGFSSTSWNTSYLKFKTHIHNTPDYTNDMHIERGIVQIPYQLRVGTVGLDEAIDDTGSGNTGKVPLYVVTNESLHGEYQNWSNGHGYYGAGSPYGENKDPQFYQCTARFGGSICLSSGAVRVNSDKRIKRDIDNLNSEKSLNILENIKCKKFRYKDPTLYSNSYTYGFIAQEIKEYIPEAVKHQNDLIPNFCFNVLVEKHQENSNQYFLEPEIDSFNFDDLEISENKDVIFSSYDLIKSNELDKDVSLGFKLISKINNKRILVESKNELPKKLFLRGQYVDNFNSLDKDLIFTIGISSLQEINKRQQADKVKITNLENELSTVKQQYNDLLSRIVALENK